MIEKLLLCTPTGRPLGRALLDDVPRIGFRGIRQDVPDDHRHATELLRELKHRLDIYPLFLLAGGHMRRGHMSDRGEAGPWQFDELIQHTHDVCTKLRDLGFFLRPPEHHPAIEIGNEPDLAAKEWKTNPRLLARAFSECVKVVRSFSLQAPVLTPSVSNLNKRGFRYLEAMLAEGLPEGAVLAVHRYPHKGQPDRPHDGFHSREAEASKLVELAGGRDIWITEAGLSEGPHDGEFRSEEFVADAVESDVSFWNRVAAVKTYCVYQINDGPDPRDFLHHFGVRRLDGSWKPVARAARQALDDAGDDPGLRLLT